MKCGIPVIHSEYSEWGNNLYPILTVEYNNVESFLDKIRWLRKSGAIYEVVNNAQKLAGEKYSLKVCEDRVDEFLKRLSIKLNLFEVDGWSREELITEEEEITEEIEEAKYAKERLQWMNKHKEELGL